MTDCGIYCITNSLNGHTYVGQSTKIKKRWQEHIRDLKYSRHCNSHLQRAYDYYGIENFTFQVVEECSPNNLDQKEIDLINLYKSLGVEVYNLTDGGRGRRGYKLSPEIIAKMVQRRAGFKHSRETKEYISYIQKGRHLTAEWKQNISLEHKASIASGKFTPNTIGLQQYNEIQKTSIIAYNSSGTIVGIYDSIQGAARELGVLATNICKVLKGRHNTCNGVTFIYSQDAESVSINDILCRFTIHQPPIRYKKRSVALIGDNDVCVSIYDSITEAAQALDLDGSSITKVCNGKLKQTKGFRFSYIA